MKKNSKNLFKEVDDFFGSPPSVNQKAWGIINDFYHMILTHMERREISKSDLAKRLCKSRSAISQMFNKTPNFTIKKMVEIADAIGLNMKITSDEVPIEGTKPQKEAVEPRVLVVYINNSPQQRRKILKVSEFERGSSYSSYKEAEM